MYEEADIHWSKVTEPSLPAYGKLNIEETRLTSEPKRKVTLLQLKLL
jgi:hypothetical protein